MDEIEFASLFQILALTTGKYNRCVTYKVPSYKIYSVFIFQRKVYSLTKLNLTVT